VRVRSAMAWPACSRLHFRAPQPTALTLRKNRSARTWILKCGQHSFWPLAESACFRGTAYEDPLVELGAAALMGHVAVACWRLHKTKIVPVFRKTDSFIPFTALRVVQVAKKPGPGLRSPGRREWFRRRAPSLSGSCSGSLRHCCLRSRAQCTGTSPDS
jgi:hypothetical protein